MFKNLKRMFLAPYPEVDRRYLPVFLILGIVFDIVPICFYSYKIHCTMPTRVLLMMSFIFSFRLLSNTLKTLNHTARV